MGDWKSIGYGQGGGRGQISRFAEAGDPTPYLIWQAAGSLVVNTPAHLMGNAGGAYYYGTTKVGGITNMISNGQVLRSYITPSVTGNYTITGRLGGFTPGGFDAILHGHHMEGWFGTTPYVSLFPVVNGEFMGAVVAEDSASREPFTHAGKTLTATTGLTAITFSASVAADPLTFAYGYTVNMPVPRSGDLIAITDSGGGGVHYYRLQTNPAGAGVIFPAYTGAGGAGLAFQIYRTGYGSYSHLVPLHIGAADVYYYAGNMDLPDSGFNAFGTIECVVGANHYMAPTLSPSTAKLDAVDVAFYKGFLLYGFGGAIGWSVAGFPTVAVAPFFGATDFPDFNISVIDQEDDFVCFEFIGDQLVAFFSNGAWLIQATGVIPEFAFYKLPMDPGVRLFAFSDPQRINGGSFFSWMRPSTTKGSHVTFVSRQGLMEIAGSPPAQHVSQAVDNYDFPATGFSKDGFQLKYDSASDTVAWFDHDGGRALALRGEEWFQIDLTATYPNARFFGGNFYPFGGTGASGQLNYRPLSLAFWDPVTTNVFGISDNIEREVTTTSTCPWSAASPILNLGRLYPGWLLGGLEIWARAAATVSTANLTWTLYGGRDPYHMQIIQGPVTYNYAPGFGDARQRLGGTFDYPFYGIVLTGSKWIELAGVVFYSSESKAV